MLLDDVKIRVEALGESEFSIPALFSPTEWGSYTAADRRAVGRSVYGLVKKGLWDDKNSVIEILKGSNPQHYRKRRQQTSPSLSLMPRVFLNEIPQIELTAFADMVKVLGACGLWLEIVPKPSPVAADGKPASFNPN
jgi:hypothetical protein